MVFLVKCSYCAEEIQDAARLCRFCGASENAEGNWIAPSNPTLPRSRRKGPITIRIAGALLLLSGALGLLSWTSDVAFLGGMRSGAVAIGYNLFFVALFFALGAGLIVGRTWGYRLLFAGTLVYTVDRLAFVIDKRTREAFLASGGLSEEVRSLIDMNMIDQGVILATLFVLICWWGFALYIYARRDYFR